MAEEHTHDDYGPHTHDGDDVGHDHDDTAVAEPAAPAATAPAAMDVGPAPGGLAVRIALTILGAAGMIIGAFLNWGGDTTGTNIEFRVFYSTEVGGESELFGSAGLLFIVLGLLALLGLAFRTGWLTRLAGALGIVAAVLVVISVYRAGETIAFFAVGFWLCAIGSLVALIGGFFGSRPRVIATGVAV